MTQSDYLSNFTQPPVDMVCPHTAQLVITAILGVLSVAVAVFSIVEWRRTGQPTMLATSIGGLLASFNEPIMDIVGRVWFADGGQQWTAFQTFGRPVAVWVPMAYFVFFGAFPYLMARYFQIRGAGPRQYWAAVAVPVVLNTALEVPLLQRGVYVYYGNQPFAVLGFPVFWTVINTLGVVLTCTLILVYRRYLTGARVWVLAVVPVATQLGAAAIGLPIFSVGNTTAPTAVLWLAATVPFVLGFIGFRLLGQVIAHAVAVPRTFADDRLGGVPTQDSLSVAGS